MFSITLGIVAIPPIAQNTAANSVTAISIAEAPTITIGAKTVIAVSCKNAPHNLEITADKVSAKPIPWLIRSATPGMDIIPPSRVIPTMNRAATDSKPVNPSIAGAVNNANKPRAKNI